nr:hypothetical protein [Tanacetum cinerariifolium]
TPSDIQYSAATQIWGCYRLASRAKVYREPVVMSSALSAVTYTSVYTDSEPGRVFRGADEELSDEGSSRVIIYGYDGLPMQPEYEDDESDDGCPLDYPIDGGDDGDNDDGYVDESDLEEDLEEYEEDETEDGPGYGDDDDIGSSRYDADNEDEDEEEEEEVVKHNLLRGGCSDSGIPSLRSTSGGGYEDGGSGGDGNAAGAMRLARRSLADGGDS